MAKKRFVGKYETILDHNPTPEEFEEITGFEWDERLEFIQIMNTMTPHAGWYKISLLYEKRGDLEMAKKYDKPLPQWELNRQIIDEVY
jgi:hypothetical protein